MTNQLDPDEIKSQVNSLGKIGWSFEKIRIHFAQQGLATEAQVRKAWDEINKDIRQQNRVIRRKNRAVDVEIKNALTTNPAFREISEMLGLDPNSPYRAVKK